MPNHAEQLAQELNLSLKNVQGAIDLIDAGNTIPFIARYRKEATGSMDDQVLRNLGRFGWCQNTGRGGGYLSSV